MSFFDFLDWIVTLWNDMFSVLSDLKIGGASFTLIIISFAFLNIVIFRLITSKG